MQDGGVNAPPFLFILARIYKRGYIRADWQKKWLEAELFLVGREEG